MKVIINTQITQYNTDTLIKPRAPLWYIRNTGDTPVIINDQNFLLQNDGFGVDAENIIAAVIQHYANNPTAKNIEVINDTQFKVSFNTPVRREPKFELIETFFTIER